MLSTCLLSASVLEPWTRRVPPGVKALDTQECLHSVVKALDTVGGALVKVRVTMYELENSYNMLSTCIMSASVVKPWTRRVPPVVEALDTQDCIAFVVRSSGHGV